VLNTGSPPAAEETSASSSPIALRSPDAAIRARLVQLFREMGGLEGVTVRVRAGVVTLSGTTLDLQTSDEAESVASRVYGVVSVQNNILVERRIEQRLQPLAGKTEELVRTVIAFLPILAIALIVFGSFWLAGAIFTRRTNIFRRLAPNPFIEALFEQVVRLVFIIIGLVVAMSILGATALIGTVLGAAGVISLAVGFALRDTIENYIASILLSLRQPFAPNDAVLIDGIDGRITTLDSRATIITTWDGNEVRIPNAIVYKAKIMNYSRTPERRFEFEIRVRLATELDCALAIAMRAAKQMEGVLEEPQPVALIDRIEDYTAVLKVLAWVDQTRSDFHKTRSETIRALKDALEIEHIDITTPVQLIRYVPDETQDAAGAPSQPTPQEMRAVQDTSPDTTIEQKVEERRAEASEDMLTPSARRE
jgi:small-conductance mechanosensitive channel